MHQLQQVMNFFITREEVLVLGHMLNQVLVLKATVVYARGMIITE